MRTIIENGSIVTGEKTYTADLILENGVIKKIGKLTKSDYEKKDTEVLDASKKYILPGCIDVHTHLDLDTGTTSTSDDFNTGSRAAVAGGTTMFIDFATQDKGGSLLDAVKKWDEKAKKGVFCDYSYHMAIIDWNKSVKNEMSKMVELGIPSFKMYMAYKGTLQVDDGVIYEALKESKEIGGIIGFHCENGDLVKTLTKELIKDKKTSPYYHQYSRPDILEEEAIFRLGEIAKLADSYFWLVHLSSKKGRKILSKFKKEGLNFLVETCPQYLVLDNSVYKSKDYTGFETAKYVLSPPIRTKEDQEDLWQATSESKIDFISTDHCSFNFKGQKDIGENDFSKIPNGAPGIEHRLILLYTYGVCTGEITLNQLVKLLSENPANYFGIKNKGKISEGYDGDIVIFDPNKEDVISYVNQIQNVDYTPYEGLIKKGLVETVFLNGEKIYHKGKFIKDKPTGKFIKREKFSGFN